MFLPKTNIFLLLLLLPQLGKVVCGRLVEDEEEEVTEYMAKRKSKSPHTHTGVEGN